MKVRLYKKLQNQVTGKWYWLYYVTYDWIMAKRMIKEGYKIKKVEA